jgi:hypothetical protein
MNDSQLQDKTSYLIYFIIGVFPFLVFYRTVPFLSDLTIGSDYLLYPIRQQIELLFSLKAGSFPLYVPGFASGHSSSALTLGQIFHPLSHIVSIMPGYWNGKAIEWNNLFKLLSLGLTQVVLFVFLRNIRVNLIFSFLLSFITVYNLRLLDLYRHGASLEAYTGHLILCSVIGLYFIRATRWIGPLCIIGVTYLLTCSGHPEEIYYGLLGAGMFALVAPFYLSNMLLDRKVDVSTALRFWLKIGFLLCLGIVLSSVYILPFYFDFVTDNIQRVGVSYDLADIDLDPFVRVINNFFRPLSSDVYGAFGGSSLILMAAILPVLRLFKVKIPFSVWIIWGLLLLVFLHMQGSRTPVHRLVWQYFPFASSIRVAGRISIIAPFLVMVLLAWLVKEESYSLRFLRGSLMVKPLTVLSCIALLLIIIYYLLYIFGYYVLSSSIFLELFRPHGAGYFFSIPFLWVEFIVIIFGIAALIALTVYSARINTARVFSILLIFFAVIQVGIVLKYRGAHWIEKRYDSPTFASIQKQKKNKLDYIYYAGIGLQSSVVVTHLERSFMEPFLGRIYTQVIPVSSRDNAYQKMERSRLQQEIFIEGYSPESARIITERAKNMIEGTVDLIYSSFNRIQFRVYSQERAFLGLSYPYTGHWDAWVNGEDVQIYRANGAAHSVEIPSGESIVEFRYWSSAFFWGMLISCTTFAVIGIFVCFRGLKGLPRVAGMIIILIIGVGGFMLWYDSLYSGDNLETEYSWNYTLPLKTPNLAYGKKSWVTPLTIRCGICGPDLSHTRLVDGDISPNSGYTSRLSDSPAFFIDLYELENIKEIVLYESLENPAVDDKPLKMLESHDSYPTLSVKKFLVNIRPLKISLSDDGNKWNTVTSVVSQPHRDVPIRIVFEGPERARYIKITSSGKSHLSLDEVEIYGP